MERRRGEIRLRSNVVMSGDARKIEAAWEHVPGEIVERYKPNWLSAARVSTRQRSENGYYLECTRCHRLAHEIGLSGCAQPQCDRPPLDAEVAVSRARHEEALALIAAERQHVEDADDSERYGQRTLLDPEEAVARFLGLEALVATPGADAGSAEPPAHQSDSKEQRSAKTLILAKVANHIGCVLAPARVTFDTGTPVQVDGVASDESVFVEIYARQGTLKGGQKKKVAQDALKLITLQRSRPGARLIIAFADEGAARHALQGSWVSEALSNWGIEVLVVQLEETIRGELRAAQARKTTVNREAPPAIASDVARSQSWTSPTS